MKAAWAADEVGEAQVEVPAGAQRAAAACFERDEPVLVAEAGRLSYRRFCQAVAHWRQHADRSRHRRGPPRRSG